MSARRIKIDVLMDVIVPFAVPNMNRATVISWKGRKLVRDLIDLEDSDWPIA
jgi:hypothetical protein